MSRSNITNKRTVPVQGRPQIRNYNDPFRPQYPRRAEDQVHYTNKHNDTQQTHHVVPGFGTNLRMPGRPRDQRFPVGMSKARHTANGNVSMKPKTIGNVNVRPNANGNISTRPGACLEQRYTKRFLNERIVSRIKETLKPILKFTEFPEDFLENVLLPCVPSEKAGILVAGVLLCASKKRGKDIIEKLWRESELRWSDVFGIHSTSVEEFIIRNKLKFLDIPTNVKVQMKSSEVMKAYVPKVVENQTAIEGAKQTLLRLLENNFSNETIYKHINMRRLTFTVSALVFAVLERAISGENYDLNEMQLKERIPLLKLYINHNVRLELQAIYALQSLMVRLGHPHGLLQQIFQVLHDADVIKKETFKTWESSTDPSESDGKALAVISVNRFLKELAKESQEGPSERQVDFSPSADKCCVS